MPRCSLFLPPRSAEVNVILPANYQDKNRIKESMIRNAKKKKKLISDPVVGWRGGGGEHRLVLMEKVPSLNYACSRAFNI